MPRICDLTGQRFGSLTVIKKTKEKEDGYFVWLCICDCGNEIKVSTKRLKRGNVISCGCIKKEPGRRGASAENLEGRRFGKLTVIRRAENLKGRVRWECICDCGKMHTASAHDLKSGKCKSCGCDKYKKLRGIVDLKGRRFGRLVALCPLDRRDKKGSVYWKCICDCGNETEVSADGLMHGNYRSCGCLRREIWDEIPNRLHMVDGTCVEMLKNRRHRRDNTSGLSGVYKLKNGKYRVTLGFKGKRYYLGTFEDYDEAKEERLKAERIVHDGFVEAYYKWKLKESRDPDWAKTHPFIFEVRLVNGEFEITTNIE